MFFAYDGGEDACTNPECCHTEPNIAKWCPKCQKLTMLVRDPRGLEDGSVYAYDPWCGETYHVRVAQV